MALTKTSVLTKFSKKKEGGQYSLLRRISDFIKPPLKIMGLGLFLYLVLIMILFILIVTIKW